MTHRFSWTRRTFSRNLLLPGLGAWAACKRPAEPSSTLPFPGGVLLTTADDLGWRDLSSFGLATVQTQNMDRLADEGVAVDRAFDLDSDPLERTNLIDDPDHRGTLATLRALLLDHPEATADDRLQEL